MKKLFAVILAGLLLPVFCFGALTYERSPSYYTLENPVEFHIAVSTSTDFGCSGEETLWGLLFDYGTGERYYHTATTSIETLEKTFVETLTLAEYWTVEIWCFDDEGAGVLLESDDCLPPNCYPEENPIFEVVGEGESLWTPGNAVRDTAGVITDLASSIGPFLWAFIGIPLGFVVVKRVIKILPK